MPAPTNEPAIRIGELARRAGIPPATLRAWERRYGIVRPERTEGGYRLYTAADERRLRKMVDLISRGLAPAEAARQAGREEEAPAPPLVAPAPPAVAPHVLQEELLTSIRGLDEPALHGVIDRAIAAYGPGGMVEQVVLPVLRAVGDLWSADEMTVAQEHFGSQLIKGRLQSLSRALGEGPGPPLVLACPPGENHDLPLTAFGIMLHGRGRQIAMLGSNTPIATVAEAAAQLRAEAVVLAVTDAGAASAIASGGPLGVGCPLYLGGPAATEDLARAIGARLLPASMPEAAGVLAAA